MSEEELNQELSTDELKDVAGGSWTMSGNVSKKGNPQWGEICDVGLSVKGDLKTGDLIGKKGRKQTESLDATQFGNGDGEHT